MRKASKRRIFFLFEEALRIYVLTNGRNKKNTNLGNNEGKYKYEQFIKYI